MKLESLSTKKKSTKAKESTKGLTKSQVINLLDSKIEKTYNEYSKISKHTQNSQIPPYLLIESNQYKPKPKNFTVKNKNQITEKSSHSLTLNPAEMSGFNEINTVEKDNTWSNIKNEAKIPEVKQDMNKNGKNRMYKSDTKFFSNFNSKMESENKNFKEHSPKFMANRTFANFCFSNKKIKGFGSNSQQNENQSMTERAYSTINENRNDTNNSSHFSSMKKSYLNKMYYEMTNFSKNALNEVKPRKFVKNESLKALDTKVNYESDQVIETENGSITLQEQIGLLIKRINKDLSENFLEVFPKKHAESQNFDFTSLKKTNEEFENILLQAVESLRDDNVLKKKVKQRNIINGFIGTLQESLNKYLCFEVKYKMENYEKNLSNQIQFQDVLSQFIPEIVVYFDSLCSVRGKILKTVLIQWMNILYVFSNMQRHNFNQQEMDYLKKSKFTQVCINSKLLHANKNIEFLDNNIKSLETTVNSLTQEKIYLSKLIYYRRQNEKKLAHDLKALSNEHKVLKNKLLSMQFQTHDNQSDLCKFDHKKINIGFEKRENDVKGIQTTVLGLEDGVTNLQGHIDQVQNNTIEKMNIDLPVINYVLKEQETSTADLSTKKNAFTMTDESLTSKPVVNLSPGDIFQQVAMVTQIKKTAEVSHDIGTQTEQSKNLYQNMYKCKENINNTIDVPIKTTPVEQKEPEKEAEDPAIIENEDVTENVNAKFNEFYETLSPEIFKQSLFEVEMILSYFNGSKTQGEDKFKISKHITKNYSDFKIIEKFRVAQVTEKLAEYETMTKDFKELQEERNILSRELDIAKNKVHSQENLFEDMNLDYTRYKSYQYLVSITKSCFEEDKFLLIDNNVFKNKMATYMENIHKMINYAIYSGNPINEITEKFKNTKFKNISIELDKYKEIKSRDKEDDYNQAYQLFGLKTNTNSQTNEDFSNSSEKLHIQQEEKINISSEKSELLQCIDNIFKMAISKNNNTSLKKIKESDKKIISNVIKQSNLNENIIKKAKMNLKDFVDLKLHLNDDRKESDESKKTAKYREVKALTIKSIYDLMRLQSLKVRFVVNSYKQNPTFVTVNEIIEQSKNIESREALKTGVISQKLIQKLFDELFKSLQYQHKFNRNSIERQPLSVLLFEYYLSLYNDKKTPQMKFKQCVESLLSIIMLKNTRKNKSFGKQEIFANFLEINEVWDFVHLDIYLRILQNIGDHSISTTEIQTNTMICPSKFMEIALDKNVCELDFDKKILQKKYIDINKFYDTDSNSYKLNFEQTMQNYFELKKYHDKYFYFVLPKYYILTETEENDVLEFWEFQLVLKYMEPEYYTLEQALDDFYENADHYRGKHLYPCMTLQKFTQICLVKNLLNSDSMQSYLIRYNIQEVQNENKFKEQFFALKSNKLRMTFEKFQCSYMCYDKVLKKIELALLNPCYYSFSSIKSTYNILYNEAMEFQKNEYLYENFLPNEYERVINEVKNVQDKNIEKTLVKTMTKLESELE